MANVLFTRTATPSEKPITDGQLIFDTSGNGKMYLDNGTERLVMGGALTVDTTLSKTSTNPIQNKGVAGVMLDNLEDISNVTSKGFLTDALATKKLNESLTASDGTLFRFGVDDNGNYGYIVTDSEGADSVVPFKSESELHHESYLLNARNWITISLLEEPKKLIAVYYYTAGFIYDVVNDEIVIGANATATGSYTNFANMSEDHKTFDLYYAHGGNAYAEIYYV